MDDETTTPQDDAETQSGGSEGDQASESTHDSPDPATLGTQQTGQVSLSHPQYPINPQRHGAYERTFMVRDCQRQNSNFCHWEGSYCPSCGKYTTGANDTLGSLGYEIWGAGNELWRDIALLNLAQPPCAAQVDDLLFRPGVALVLP